jgi:preprotein translocase subunit SecG
MGSLQKTRVLVFSLFFIALIIFAVLYRPADAISQPTVRSNSSELLR